MPSAYIQGITRVADVTANVEDSNYAIIRAWNANRTPLFSRVAARPVDSYVIRQWPHKFRPRTTTLGAAVADAVTTTITLANASIVMNGDNLLLNSGEVVEVVDHPNTTNNTVTVLRGASGTTAAAQGNGTTVTNLGNSRTGAEIDQKAISEIPGSDVQYVQTYQHRWSVGGGVQAVRTRYQGPATPYAAEKQDKMVNIVDDIEVSAMYGLPQAIGGAFARYKQKGLFNLIATHNVTAPTNAAAYKPSDLIADAIQPIIDSGGTPDVGFCSSAWLTGLAVWGFPALRLDAGATRFGTAINAFAIPFFPDITFIPCPQMTGKSVIIGSGEEMYWGVLRALDSYDVGKRGDADEGEWVAAMAINLEQEAHFAAVRNITVFAKEA